MDIVITTSDKSVIDYNVDAIWEAVEELGLYVASIKVVSRENV